ncbi:MAG: cupin domain-containing protein [Oligoflexia bacterium]|nr:cupin domain-containing protein [Oligoflexia bacterium]
MVEGPKVANLIDQIQYSPGSIVSKEIHRVKQGSITLFAFDNEQKLDEHSAPFDAVVQVLDGEAEIKIAGTPFRVIQGQFIIMPANRPHAVRAKGRMKMMLTMIRSE